MRKKKYFLPPGACNFRTCPYEIFLKPIIQYPARFLAKPSRHSGFSSLLELGRSDRGQLDFRAGLAVESTKPL